jgi:zinc finger protein
LRIEDKEDLSRDILKVCSWSVLAWLMHQSESCALSIPEIELELDAGTLGGKFTTIEGLLTDIHTELDSRSPFAAGDSIDNERRARMHTFLGKLAKLIQLESPFTIILDDALGNSYLQNLYAPDPDPNMSVEHYDRTWEQNEFLGLNDLHTESTDGPDVPK